MPKRDPVATNLAPRIKVWLAWKGGFLMGPNYLRFLQGVDASGTIRGGGKSAGWSYRTCLNRVRRLESALGEPVLVTSRGGAGHGGARLTPIARRLIRIFDAWRHEMHLRSDLAFRKAMRGG